MLIKQLYRLIHYVLFTHTYRTEDIPLPNPVENKILNKFSCISLYSYKNTHIRNIIHHVKYRGNGFLIHILGLYMYQEIKKYIQHSNIHRNSKTIIIPVPLSKKKQRKRGYNQTELLMKSILLHDTDRLLENGTKLIIKTKETKSQTTCNRLERLSNTQGAFALTSSHTIKGRNIIVIDDVVTTGSTLYEIIQLLNTAEINHIQSFTLAH